MQSGGRIAAFAGAWSFPLYAIHFPLLIWVRYFGYGWITAVVLALVLSALLTMVEKRIHQ